MPFFSVIIPLYNKELYIKNTIQSVLNQTFKDFEIIVINDGSTDNSYNVLKTIKDSRITIYSNKNNGLAYSRNYGIQKSNSNYLALLDADDLWTNNYLESIKNMITRYNTQMVFATNYNSWSKKKMPYLINNPTKKTSYRLITNYFNLRKNIFSFSSIVFHKSVFSTIGYFNEKVNYGEEEEFSIKCFSYYNLVYTTERKVFYLKNIENQLTAPNKNSKRILPDYETYLTDKSPKDLKKYIDFIHYKVVILYKMEKNNKLIKAYQKKIDPSNLSITKKIKYVLPTPLFYALKSFYSWVLKICIHC